MTSLHKRKKEIWIDIHIEGKRPCDNRQIGVSSKPTPLPYRGIRDCGQVTVALALGGQRAAAIGGVQS